MGDSFVVALDVGTTNVKAFLFNQKAEIVVSATQEIALISPHPGWYEQDPFLLLDKVKAVISEVLAHVDKSSHVVLGITNQRNSFVLWDKTNSKPIYNFILWQDLRAAKEVENWNQSFVFKSIQNATAVAHFFTRKQRFLQASVIGMNTTMSTPTLEWALNNIPAARALNSENKLMFGTVDTWIIWNFTEGKSHVTDYSNFSTTGLFDPYILSINKVVTKLLGIPHTIFPEIKDSNALFGECAVSIFGRPLPIHGVMADQQSALFGECCFEAGEVKCTIGTGCFIDINTGKKPMASTHGMMPIVGWKIGNEIRYVLEGGFSACGTVINWARDMGLYTDVNDTCAIASSVPDTTGIIFVPAFAGLSSPHNDPTARGLMIGMTAASKKEHLVRALLESFGYRCKEIVDTIRNDAHTPILCMRADGGVTRNDFVVQFCADMIDIQIERSAHADMTAVGACYMAGLGSGIWKSQDELRSLRKVDKVFTPSMRPETRAKLFAKWEKGVALSMNWADDDDIGYPPPTAQ
eukprot:Phypoly_transcript_07390.p1 GENE.Phypoly_transcript_07390~~Phypoly_transcript_07390.p1  ORF type:complete len:537 (+),score=79.19 Phypoly_transcript_07390:45-1613(+)